MRRGRKGERMGEGRWGMGRKRERRTLVRIASSIGVLEGVVAAIVVRGRRANAWMDLLSIAFLSYPIQSYPIQSYPLLSYPFPV